MSEAININGTVSRLLTANNILIVCHKNPDGDTLGSAGALYWALHSLDKTAAVICSSPVPESYSYMNLCMFTSQFKPEYVVAVDIAGTQLFGDATIEYAESSDLCIDHHASNSGFARFLLLDATAAATCEMIYNIIVSMGVSITPQIAECLYTGVSTDTGCFRFANTTAATHRISARLIELGADISFLNELLFETKSKGRIAVEQMALSSLEYHFDETCALICISRDQIEKAGAEEADLEGITSMPRSIEGVIVGITMRQQKQGSYKVSVRTKVGIDASVICQGLGGGGHKQAAGCEIVGGEDNAKQAVLAEVEKQLNHLKKQVSI